jgi:hypothetical protein
MKSMTKTLAAIALSALASSAFAMSDNDHSDFFGLHGASSSHGKAEATQGASHNAAARVQSRRDDGQIASGDHTRSAAEPDR